MSSRADPSTIRRFKEAATEPKARLIAVWHSLDANGAKAEARKLERIIGRLEAWQNS